MKKTLLIVAMLLAGIACSAQIKFQVQNGGTAIYTRGGGLVQLNCSTNVTCTASGNVVSITSTFPNGLTNVANSLGANQIIVGNTYPDTLITNCTIGVVATDAIYCPGGFYATSLAQNGSVVVNKLAKQTGTNLIIAAVTDQNIPTFPVILVPDASHAYIQMSGQASLIFDGATTADQYVIASATSAGEVSSSATCPAGDWFLGRVMSANVGGGTYAVNLSPGWCPGGGGVTTFSKTIVVGAENGAVLLNADLGPQRAQFQIPVASTITEIDVKADATAGVSPTNVIVAKRVCTASPCGTGANETVTNLLSGALAVTATSGATTCSRTAAVAGIDGFTTCTNTLQNNTSFPAGGYIELVSGTADGTTKRLSVTVTWTTP